MDLSFLPTPVTECNKRTGAHFTVRSANSPSYSLTRRPGVRKQKGFSEDEREGAEDVGESERYGTNPSTNGENQEDGVAGYQARTGGRSSVKDQQEEKETSGHEMFPKLSRDDTGDKMITVSALESQGRTEKRRFNLSSKSQSLDWRMDGQSPVWGTRADTIRGGDINKQPGGLDERGTRAEAVRGRLMPSIHVNNSAGGTNVAQERNPVSHLSQTLDRVSRGHSLPYRLRSQSGPGSWFTETATSFGPKGGQSILERIEKLYGSAGFGKAEDNSTIRDYSTTSADISPQQSSYQRGAGGTFPRRLSLGEKYCLSPMQSIKSVTWTTQKDTSGSESSLSPGKSRRSSGGQWQEKVQGKYSQESAVNWGKGLVEIGTQSLDRARSRNTLAAQIRSARVAGGITALDSSSFLEEETSVALKDSSEFRERGANGSKHQDRASHGKEKGETNGINVAKEKTEMKSDIAEVDVFESNPNKTTLKSIERKNFTDNLSVPSAASVRNKINQFEALSQRAQGLASGHPPMPKRAFSVPTQHSSVHDGVKKSGSAKAIGGLRDKWEGSKEGCEVHDEAEEKVTGAGKKHLLERFLSVDEVGLARKERERSEWEGEKEADSGDNCSEDFGKYARLKSALEIPLNGGAQRRRRNVHIDETDFAKVSSPEDARGKDITANNTPSSLPSSSSDTTATVQKVALSGDSPPASDDDTTPTNTPNHSPLLSPTAQMEKASPIADTHVGTSVFTHAATTPDPDSSPPPRPLAASSHSNLPDLISPDDRTAHQKRKKKVLDLDAWVAGLNSAIKVWNADEDYEDDDESTQKDDDSNYDSDSGESSVTITSNMSQSDHRSFCVSLSDLCNFAGVDYESENDSDEWQSTGRRSASLSSDVSALSYVSVMPSEELDRLLEDVRSLGDNNLQDYDDVQVAVLHKEVGVGLGFSVAGGVDQNKPVTVHRVFHSGVAAQQGSIREGDQVLSINGTALCGHAHWEVLRVLRRAKNRETGVVVLRRGGVSGVPKSGVQTSVPGPTQTLFTEAGQQMCVCLEKNSRDLGFSLEGGVGSSLGNRPLTVQKIFQGGPVEKVCPGDQVLEIEGVSVVGMRRLEAWALIRKLPPGPVDVILCRPLNHQET